MRSLGVAFNDLLGIFPSTENLLSFALALSVLIFKMKMK